MFFTGNLRGPRQNGFNMASSSETPLPPCRAADGQEAATTRKNTARHEKTVGPLGIVLPTLAPPAPAAGDEGFPSQEMPRSKKISLKHRERWPCNSKTPGDGDQLKKWWKLEQNSTFLDDSLPKLVNSSQG